MKQMKKSKLFRRTGRGSVALIALLLISSAVLRLVAGSGIAIAQTSDDAGLVPVLGNEQYETTSPGKNRSEMSKLLVALQKREAEIEKRETQIKMRSKSLDIADQEITKRLDALERAELQLRGTMALADGAAEKDLARLTSVYESMKPKDASALFEMMEPDFAAGFLGRMRPDAAAAILSGLSADAAYSISVILASRNANVPKT